MILQTYECHKVVKAAEILGISLGGELGFGPGNFVVKSREWLDRHNPEVGGYYVEYENGYCSYSPKEPFEQGYTLVQP